ncbi:serine-rich adhesin for platelets-like [Saccostrea cucullata]|uniref:serine-rich adhesin for platelets-like n=1 Tax=Saccostrea cuccullata TaxID=36930 RepID=UPI002ED57043
MTTHRKLKYSVSDASRRMYRDETNGIYRKLDNPSPTENQLRQQRFEARQRPLSHILASSSFREDFNRNQITRGQSLSNLKKARLRNSLNLPHSFSLDLGYDVDANANLDDFSARSGNLREITVSGDSAFGFVPERDIISLGDISSSQATNCRASKKSPSVASVGSKRSSFKSEKFRKSSSSSSTSTSQSHSSRSRSSSPKQKYKTQDIEHVLDNTTNSEGDESSKIQKVLHKRPSFKEIFPEPVNQEFMDKSVERKSVGRLSFSEKDTNRIFDSEEGIQTNVKNDSSSLRRTKLNTSLSTDSGESDSPKTAHKVFDSTDHFQRSFLFPGTVNKPETTPSDSESSCKEGSYILDTEFYPSEKPCVSVISPHSLTVCAHLASLDNTDSENGDISDNNQALKGNIKLDRTVSLGDAPPPLPQSSPPDVIETISLGSYAGNDFVPSEVKQMASESFASTGKTPGYLRTSVAYYGPIYASNNTLILPTKSAQPSLDQCGNQDYRSDDDTTSNSSASSASLNHKHKVQNAEKENVTDKVISEMTGLTEDTPNQSIGNGLQNDFVKRNSSGSSSSSNEEHSAVLENQIAKKEDDNTISDNLKACLAEVTLKLNSASEPQFRYTRAGSEQKNSPSVNAEIHQVLETLDNAILGVSEDTAEQDTVKHRGHHVVVAIDFGTTYSGYAYSFTRDPSHVHLMRKWEGGDPGVINEKTPTSILLTPEGQFHSFGYSARDNYHDLGKEEAKTWMYFEKFKMILHNTPELSKDTLLKASNGRLFPAMTVFSLALKFFRDHALQELSDQSGMKILNEDVRWVISVPAIWRASAKQFIRQAAYEGGLVSSQCPEQMIIALEPEAASIYCRKLKMYQLVPEINEERPLQSPKFASVEPMNINPACEDLKEG